VGASTTEMVAFHEGKIQHIAVLPVGGDTITNDLVRGLSIPFAEAQKAKERHGVALAQLVDPQETVELPGPGPGQRREVARELIAHIVEQRLDEIFGLVHQNLEAAGVLDRLGAGVVLTGGPRPWTACWRWPSSASPPRSGWAQPGEGLSGLAAEVARPRFATVAGACLLGATVSTRPARGRAPSPRSS
jgi:cell division protein FtsA